MADKCFNNHHLIEGKIWNKPRYHKNKIWCNVCHISFKYQGLKCPCCHMDVRLRPRQGKTHEQFLEVVKRY